MAQDISDFEMTNSFTRKISIILPCFNAEASITGAIKSIVDLRFPDVEIVVVDGGSTDKTLYLVKDAGVPIRHIHSGPDRGIYDAMNKGIQLASGNWLYFMGADDRLLIGSSELFQYALNAQLHHPAIFFGDVMYENGRLFRSRFGWPLLLWNNLHHQGAVYSRTLFEEFHYDIAFEICADYELNLRAYLSGVTAKRINVVVARCSCSGISYSNRKNARSETAKIRKRNMKYSGPFQLLASAAFLFLDATRKIRYRER